MKKIEYIWRELLEQVIEKKNNEFKIADLAKKFNLSTSVVYHGLIPLRQLNIVQVGKFTSKVIFIYLITQNWAFRLRI